MLVIQIPGVQRLEMTTGMDTETEVDVEDLEVAEEIVAVEIIRMETEETTEELSLIHI